MNATSPFDFTGAMLFTVYCSTEGLYQLGLHPCDKLPPLKDGRDERHAEKNLQSWHKAFQSSHHCIVERHL